MVEVSNGRNCETCNKSAVCKYQEEVVDETKQLIETVKDMDLPLSLNIGCNEYTIKISSALR